VARAQEGPRRGPGGGARDKMGQRKYDDDDEHKYDNQI
jgi:hypothetical protein